MVEIGCLGQENEGLKQQPGLIEHVTRADEKLDLK